MERRREEGMDRREADRGGCSEEGGRDAGLRKGDRVVEGREGGARETEGGSSEGEKREEEGEGASPQSTLGLRTSRVDQDHLREYICESVEPNMQTSMSAIISLSIALA